MAINQSRPEDITMREEFNDINLGRQDEDFGDSAFDDFPSREILRDGDPTFDSVYGRDASGRYSVRGSDRASIRPDMEGDDTLIGASVHDKLGKGLTPGGASLGDDMDMDGGFDSPIYG